MPEQPKSLPDLRSDFNQGVSIAMDPINNAAIHTTAKGITTLNSYWLHQYCPVCYHTFRLGDEVEIADDKTVRHNSALLSCSQLNVTKLDFSEHSSAFFKGLDTTCPPPKDMTIVRLNANHYLLAPPQSGFQRHTCIVCSHTFRQSDRVVICPCSPNQPLCKVAVHRDIIRGLNCIEAWNPGFNQQSYCPVTSKKLDE